MLARRRTLGVVGHGRDSGVFTGPLLVGAHDPDGGQAAVLLEVAP
jgi:hypothetical protein